MGLTVAQALKFGGLASGKVLSGERCLDNEIEFVSIIEAPLESDWQIEHTLFLTTFYAIKDSQESQIQTVETLFEKGCAALVFQLGILTSLAAAVVRRAEELGLPIIQVADNVMYPEIIQPLVGAILKEKNYLLQRSDEIHRRLTDLCLGGGGIEAVTLALSELVSRPVIISDIWGCEVACSHPGGSPEPTSWMPQFRAQKADRPCSNPVYLPEAQLWIMELFSGSGRESDGFILIQDAEKTLDVLDQVAIEQASVIIALEMVKQRAVLETERRLQRDFIEDLLSETNASENTILARAHSLGWDLQNKRVIALIHQGRLRQFYLSRAGSSEDEFQAAKNHLNEAILALMKQSHPDGILVEQGEYFILLPGCERNTSVVQIRRELHVMAESICALVKEVLGGDCPILVAFGGFYDTVQTLKNSYQEAKATLRAAGQMQSFQQSVIWYEDAALYVLLDRIAAQPETVQWYQRTLGPLVEYDRVNGASLVRTLEAYFDSNQQLQHTAYHLFVHPKTLKYRLHRIEEILGTNPFSKDQQLSYYLACKLSRMIESSSEG